jgi:hypothetical protein
MVTFSLALMPNTHEDGDGIESGKHGKTVDSVVFGAFPLARRPLAL